MRLFRDALILRVLVPAFGAMMLIAVMGASMRAVILWAKPYLLSPSPYVVALGLGLIIAGLWILYVRRRFRERAVRRLDGQTYYGRW